MSARTARGLGPTPCSPWAPADVTLRLREPSWPCAGQPALPGPLSLDDLAYLTYCRSTAGRPPPPLPLAGSETTINRLGYRGREVSEARTPGEPAWSCSAGSITFGYGVRDGETFSAVMETLDAARGGEPRGPGLRHRSGAAEAPAEGLAYSPTSWSSTSPGQRPPRNAARRSIYDGCIQALLPARRRPAGRVADHVAPRRPPPGPAPQPALGAVQRPARPRAGGPRPLPAALAGPRPSRRAGLRRDLRPRAEDGRGRAGAGRGLRGPLYRACGTSCARRAAPARFLEAPELKGVRSWTCGRASRPPATAETFSRYSSTATCTYAEGHRLAAAVILEILAEEGLLPSPSPARGPS